MALDPTAPALAPLLARLHPHLARLVERAGRRALFIHSDEVTLEHLVGACMEDEDCAAYAVTVHAFADPETLSMELLALSPGMMVVGSSAALPFSTHAVEALTDARRAAREARADEVSGALVLAAAAHALPQEARDDLVAAGFDAQGLVARPGAGGVAEEGSLFRGFSDAAKEALSRSNKASHAAGETSIGPARLVLATLAVDAEARERAGLSEARARAVLTGRTRDDAPRAPRVLDADAGLIGLLRDLPGGAGSRELLLACHSEAHPELRDLLERHKVTRSLLERSHGAFRDPD